MATAPRAGTRPSARQPGRPAGTDGDQTRQAVLDVAVDAFGELGFAGIGLRELAARAGLTLGSLYHYFPTKQGLYLAAYAHAVAHTYERFEEAVAGSASVLEELDAVLDAGDQIMRERPTISRLLLRAATDSLQLELPSSVVFHRFVDGLAERAVARGEVAPERALELKLVFESMTWGLTVVGTYRPAERQRCLAGWRALLAGTLFRGA